MQILKKDVNMINSSKRFRILFPEVNTFIEKINDNKININFKIVLGDKAKKKYHLLVTKNLKIKIKINNCK